MYLRFGKRICDIVIGLIALPFVLIIVAICAPLIYFEDKGPIFYNAPRVGKDGRDFTMYKLRSMKVNAPDLVMEDGSTYNGADDPRMTRIGAFMRKASIDEMPQFINVLKGDMSIVGPRPEIPHFVEQFRDEVPLYMIRHMVKPGMTGLAQVSGYRGDTSIRGRIDCDIAYIENWTIWLDIRIILHTFTSLVNDETLPPLHREK